MEFSELFNVNERAATTGSIMGLPNVDLRRYTYQRYGEAELVCYQQMDTHNFIIMIPDKRLRANVSWFRKKLNHTGRNLLISTMSRSIILSCTKRLKTMCKAEKHVKNRNCWVVDMDI